MSDCSNSGFEPYKRCEIKIVFSDHVAYSLELPISLTNRAIHHFEADGARFTRQRNHEESWEWLNE